MLTYSQMEELAQRERAAPEWRSCDHAIARRRLVGGGTGRGGAGRGLGDNVKENRTNADVRFDPASLEEASPSKTSTRFAEIRQMMRWAEQRMQQQQLAAGTAPAAAAATAGALDTAPTVAAPVSTATATAVPQGARRKRSTAAAAATTTTPFVSNSTLGAGDATAAVTSATALLLMGPMGSGKSTLVRLLLARYGMTRVSVRLDPSTLTSIEQLASTWMHAVLAAWRYNEANRDASLGAAPRHLCFVADDFDSGKHTDSSCVHTFCQAAQRLHQFIQSRNASMPVGKHLLYASVICCQTTDVCSGRIVTSMRSCSDIVFLSTMAPDDMVSLCAPWSRFAHASDLRQLVISCKGDVRRALRHASMGWKVSGSVATLANGAAVRGGCDKSERAAAANLMPTQPPQPHPQSPPPPQLILSLSLLDDDDDDNDDDEDDADADGHSDLDADIFKTRITNAGAGSKRRATSSTSSNRGASCASVAAATAAATLASAEPPAGTAAAAGAMAAGAMAAGAMVPSHTQSRRANSALLSARNEPFDEASVRRSLGIVLSGMFCYHFRINIGCKPYQRMFVKVKSGLVQKWFGLLCQIVCAEKTLDLASFGCVMASRGFASGALCNRMRALMMTWAGHVLASSLHVDRYQVTSLAKSSDVVRYASSMIWFGPPPPSLSPMSSSASSASAAAASRGVGGAVGSKRARTRTSRASATAAAAAASEDAAGGGGGGAGAGAGSNDVSKEEDKTAGGRRKRQRRGTASANNNNAPSSSSSAGNVRLQQPQHQLWSGAPFTLNTNTERMWADALGRAACDQFRACSSTWHHHGAGAAATAAESSATHHVGMQQKRARGVADGGSVGGSVYGGGSASSSTVGSSTLDAFSSTVIQTRQRRIAACFAMWHPSAMYSSCDARGSSSVSKGDGDCSGSGMTMPSLSREIMALTRHWKGAGVTGTRKLMDEHIVDAQNHLLEK